MSNHPIRFIAYDINTAPKDPTFVDGYMPSGIYLGLDDPRQDIEARCLLMERAINTAAAQLAGVSPPDSEDTINVFMAPEFFFRGDNGAYQMDEVSYAIERLQSLAAAPVWEKWVFVFGSLVATFVDDSGGGVAYNFALVQQGGVTAYGDSGARVVTKELKSGIDFISTHANPGGILWGDVGHMPSGDPGPGRELQQANYDGAGIFDLNDITWALEICLDHGVGRLQRSPQLPGEKVVQVQLVPSCGMEVQEFSVVAGDGGLVFNSDGGGFGNTVNQVAIAGSPPVRQLHPVAAIADAAVDASNIELQSSPPRSVPISDLFAAGSGKVVLYPLQLSPLPQMVAGTVKTLQWPAAEGAAFTFMLHYDVHNAFIGLMCRIQLASLDFHDHDYFMPIRLATEDREKKPVQISMRQIKGTEGYDAAIWCDINVPGFRFDGVAFEFHDDAGKGEPYVIW
jgi:hypothetical protein